MAFGKEIKRLREEARISAEKIANQIGVNAGRWRKWEEKDFDPRNGDIQIIEEFFGMSIDEIVKLDSIKGFLKLPKKEENGFYKEVYDQSIQLSLGALLEGQASLRIMLVETRDKTREIHLAVVKDDELKEAYEQSKATAKSLGEKQKGKQRGKGSKDRGVT